jgi:hypothetical protein
MNWGLCQTIDFCNLSLFLLHIPPIPVNDDFLHCTEIKSNEELNEWGKNNNHVSLNVLLTQDYSTSQ